MNMADQVEERLRNYFLQQGFKPGDALPKENDLALALNVSRAVVREALSRLRMLGMVDSRKRRGMVLTEPDILSGMNRMMDPRILGADSMKELFELRLIVEMGVSDLLFMRRNKTDLAKLDVIVEEEEKNAVTMADHARYDIEFHSTLYHMAGNETLYRFQGMLEFVFEYARKLTEGMDGKARVGSVSHRDLVQILRKGTPESFRKAMRKHLEPYYKIL
jgi:DNA-binding FadR family transcriptional regulator